MKVKTLIGMLKSEDPEAEIILQRDKEGNSYSPMGGFWTGHYVPETTWYGTAHLSSLTDEDREIGYAEEDLTNDPNKQDAIFLVPIN